MDERVRLREFERVVKPHLDAAYNLARWLTRDDDDAQDVVQEAFLRAFRSLDGFHGADGRAWVLAIVRNVSYTWMRRRRGYDVAASLDDALSERATDGPGPEAMLLLRHDREAVLRAVEELPPEFREVIVLRELEELSYKEIATVADVPVGTVMSRLGRARARLRRSLSVSMERELSGEL